MNHLIEQLEARPYTPGYSYKYAPGQYALDSVVNDKFYVDEARMAVYIPFASGERRDGVGDLLEVTGIETDRHRMNPIVLFDHGKQIALPIAVAEEPGTKRYTVEIDGMGKTGGALCYFYGSKDGVKDYEHALFCEQIFDMMVKRFIRGGSIGYTIIEARELPADYRTGTPAGLHLIRTKMLELSAVILPANADTVSKSLKYWNAARQDLAREVLAMPRICGKPPSPYLVKSLQGLVQTKGVKANYGYGGMTQHEGRTSNVDAYAYDELPTEESKNPASRRAVLEAGIPVPDYTNHTDPGSNRRVINPEIREHEATHAREGEEWEQDFGQTIRDQEKTLPGKLPKAPSLSKQLKHIKALRQKYKGLRRPQVGENIQRRSPGLPDEHGVAIELHNDPNTEDGYAVSYRSNDHDYYNDNPVYSLRSQTGEAYGIGEADDDYNEGTSVDTPEDDPPEGQEQQHFNQQMAQARSAKAIPPSSIARGEVPEAIYEHPADQVMLGTGDVGVPGDPRRPRSSDYLSDVHLDNQPHRQEAFLEENFDKVREDRAKYERDHPPLGQASLPQGRVHQKSDDFPSDKPKPVQMDTSDPVEGRADNAGRNYNPVDVNNLNAVMGRPKVGDRVRGGFGQRDMQPGTIQSVDDPDNYTYPYNVVHDSGKDHIRLYRLDEVTDEQGTPYKSIKDLRFKYRKKALAQKPQGKSNEQSAQPTAHIELVDKRAAGRFRGDGRNYDKVDTELVSRGHDPRTDANDQAHTNITVRRGDQSQTLSYPSRTVRAAKLGAQAAAEEAYQQGVPVEITYRSQKSAEKPTRYHVADRRRIQGGLNKVEADEQASGIPNDYERMAQSEASVTIGENSPPIYYRTVGDAKRAAQDIAQRHYERGEASEVTYGQDKDIKAVNTKDPLGPGRVYENPLSNSNVPPARFKPGAGAIKAQDPGYAGYGNDTADDPEFRANRDEVYGGNAGTYVRGTNDDHARLMDNYTRTTRQASRDDDQGKSIKATRLKYRKALTGIKAGGVNQYGEITTDSPRGNQQGQTQPRDASGKEQLLYTASPRGRVTIQPRQPKKALYEQEKMQSGSDGGVDDNPSSTQPIAATPDGQPTAPTVKRMKAVDPNLADFEDSDRSDFYRTVHHSIPYGEQKADYRSQYSGERAYEPINQYSMEVYDLDPTDNEVDVDVDYLNQKERGAIYQPKQKANYRASGIVGPYPVYEEFEDVDPHPYESRQLEDVGNWHLRETHQREAEEWDQEIGQKANFVTTRSTHGPRQGRPAYESMYTTNSHIYGGPEDWEGMDAGFPNPHPQTSDQGDPGEDVIAQQEAEEWQRDFGRDPTNTNPRMNTGQKANYRSTAANHPVYERSPDVELDEGEHPGDWWNYTRANVDVDLDVHELNEQERGARYQQKANYDTWADPAHDATYGVNPDWTPDELEEIPSPETQYQENYTQSKSDDFPSDEPKPLHVEPYEGKVTYQEEGYRRNRTGVSVPNPWNPEGGDVETIYDNDRLEDLDGTPYKALSQQEKQLATLNKLLNALIHGKSQEDEDDGTEEMSLQTHQPPYANLDEVVRTGHEHINNGIRDRHLREQQERLNLPGY